MLKIGEIFTDLRHFGHTVDLATGVGLAIHEAVSTFDDVDPLNVVAVASDFPPEEIVALGQATEAADAELVEGEAVWIFGDTGSGAHEILIIEDVEVLHHLLIDHRNRNRCVLDQCVGAGRRDRIGRVVAPVIFG